jgi:hypothetical protein
VSDWVVAWLSVVVALWIVYPWSLLVLAGAAVVVGVCVAAAYLLRAAQLERRARAAAARERELALIRRCDQQHAWVLSGDERGIYGDDPGVTSPL